MVMNRKWSSFFGFFFVKVQLLIGVGLCFVDMLEGKNKMEIQNLGFNIMRQVENERYV